MNSYNDPAVWIYRATPVHIQDQIRRVLDRAADGQTMPLLGLTVAIKDNIDVVGMPTSAACPAYTYWPDRSAFVVEKLVSAGAIIFGKTNLDQFAAGLVGTRSPHGACRNVFDPQYVSGGSSSGSAVAVAADLVDFALGTDTAGSGRVPAAFNNLVGAKPTRGLLSTRGVVPACRTLDCVSVFAKDLNLAQAAFNVMRGFEALDPYSRKVPQVDLSFAEGFRFGVPKPSQLEFFGNRDYQRLYGDARMRAISIGGREVQIDFTPFQEAAALLYDGPWLAERYSVVKHLLEDQPDAFFPVTRLIIEKAKQFSAVEAFEAQYRLMAIRRRGEEELEKVDVLLLPTTGTIYTFVDLQADPVSPNRNLGYYTNFVNLLDLCALALPAGFTPAGLPMGVTFIAPADHDDALFTLGRRFIGGEKP